MENTGNDIDSRLATRLRALRSDRGLTMDGLAERSGVSRSMISLVERGESSPTASVLERLAAGLGVTLATLFAEAEREDASPVVRRADQIAWADPATGYRRRNLSPPGFPSPIELVEVELPAGARVSYDSGNRAASVDQQVYLLDGTIELTVGEVTHRLSTGDCLAMRLDRPTGFHNPTDRTARYIVALTTDGRPALNAIKR
ncbi:DNA-binding protein [Azospirillum sp. TSH100]|uniref:helix-turn-helix domain-containing protein n=1 Tax=Azospirillum sp. TSH100 TaxID=652764 RepID=UPI000D61C138|nr:XRE family transcriptional regulator [Azospirillum sp. TSH100]PWC89133.1 DNA-binding protein [Azospirillum sp. TSH100]QCG87071.1 helix-turn-helix domain-containing protein [Azospirillum sp. TSH100]